MEDHSGSFGLNAATVSLGDVHVRAGDGDKRIGRGGSAFVLGPWGSGRTVCCAGVYSSNSSVPSLLTVTVTVIATVSG